MKKSILLAVLGERNARPEVGIGGIAGGCFIGADSGATEMRAILAPIDPDWRRWERWRTADGLIVRRRSSRRCSGRGP